MVFLAVVRLNADEGSARLLLSKQVSYINILMLKFIFDNIIVK